MTEHKGEIKALTGLRGLAALDVAIAHIGDFMINKHPLLSTLFGYSFFSVELFFCLSALTLCLVYFQNTDKPLDLRRFFVARVARVYPLAILSLLIVGPYFSMWANIGSSEGRETISIGIRQLLLINHWPIVGSGDEWVAPLWSLSAEVFLYIFVFPILFIYRKTVSGLSAKKLIFSIAVLMLLRLMLKHAAPVAIQEQLWNQLAAAITMFVSGWLMYLLYSSHREQWTAIAREIDLMCLAMILIILCRACGQIFDANDLMIMGSYQEIMIFLTPFIVGGLFLDGTLASRFLSSKPVHFLGKISYSLYVWHVPVRTYIDSVYIETMHLNKDVRYFLLNMAVSLAIASLSYIYFELPARNFIRQVFLGRVKARSATSL